MGFVSVLTMAQRWVEERCGPGDVVIDATAGGGVDTLFLAKLVGPRGRVFAFDVQEEAILRTRARLTAAGALDDREWPRTEDTVSVEGMRTMPNSHPFEEKRSEQREIASQTEFSSLGKEFSKVSLFLAGHETMAESVPTAFHGRIRAIMFNLGYLPGGAKASIITKSETSIAALDAGLRLLSPGGVMTAVVYPGHEGGREEAAAVEQWFAEIPVSSAQSVSYRFPQKPAAPYLLALEKK